MPTPHAGRPVPLVGRGRELRAIDQAIAAAAQGAGGLLVLAGEAGIGKTRLAEEAVARAAAAGFATAWGSAWAGGGAPASWPWQEILGRLGAHEAVRLLDGEPAAVDPERFSRLRAVVADLVRATAGGAALLVLDDAQDADAGALVLARFAVRSLRASDILLVVTCRDGAGAGEDDPREAALADLAGEGTRLDLAGLDDRSIAELVEWAGAEQSPAVLADLVELTGGNPLLVQEALARGAGGGAPVPARVRRLLRARLAGFDAPARDVLTTAAVLGPSVDEELLAAVAGTDVAGVRDVRRRGVAAGLLRPDRAGLGFAHGLFREALLAEARPEHAGLVHDRAADVLSDARSPGGAEQLAEIAYHRLAAAEAVGTLVPGAVEAARRAAAALRARFASEPAAELLRRTCALLDRRGEAVPARLSLELAQAELAGGRLRAARDAFRRAAEVADAAGAGGAGVGDGAGVVGSGAGVAGGGAGVVGSGAGVAGAGAASEAGDAEVLAEAAIGLGGIWVLEQRRADEIGWFHQLLRRARAGVGERRPDLRDRITVRLAAEELYLGQGDLSAVREAVAMVRGSGRGRALAEALSLLHHSMLGPEHADERLPVAEELVWVASTRGEAVLTLMGVLWRTVDLLLLGDPAAERSLAELRQRADALRVQAVLYIVHTIETMLLLRDGRVAEAEAAAERDLAMGADVGDADATEYYGAQLLAIRWLQGRSGEIVPLARQLASSPSLAARDLVYRSALAALAADAGPELAGEARHALDLVRAGGLAAVPPSSSWLVTIFAVVEAAARLGDAAAAEEAYAVLLPYAPLPVMASLGVVCFGSTERSLGVAARTAGRLDDAAGHLERAVEANRRLGNRPFEALARGDLALALLERGGEGDGARADELLRSARSALRALGLDARAARLEEDAAAVRRGAATLPNRLRLAGGVWELTAGGERALVRDSRGMRHLAALLASPGHDFDATDLAGAEIPVSHQPLADRTALDAYRRRLAALHDEIDEADSFGDGERAARLRARLDRLTEEVRPLLGLGGRVREFGEAGERARTSVQKAIRRALDQMEPAAPVVTTCLRESLRTGGRCRFEPSTPAVRDWIVTHAE